MEFSQNSSLFQVQYYLNELSLHINQINEIIIQMNNFINQLNPSSLIKDMNTQMNQMNNFMMKNNNPLNFNMNINNNLSANMQNNDNFNEVIKEDNLFNIKFYYNDHFTTNIQIVKKTLTVNELLNLYLKKVNKIEYLDNYDKIFSFLFNGNELNKKKEEKIGNILKDNSWIKVYDINSFKSHS